MTKTGAKFHISIMLQKKVEVAALTSKDESAKCKYFQCDQIHLNVAFFGDQYKDDVNRMFLQLSNVCSYFAPGGTLFLSSAPSKVNTTTSDLSKFVAESSKQGNFDILMWFF